MEQVDTNLYRVRRGEVVTVQVAGTGVANTFLDFKVDTALSTEDEVGGTYIFKVVKAVPRKHFARIGCTFPGGPGKNARFDTTLSGSEGGSFAGPRIPDDSVFPVENLEFEVVA